MPTVPTVAQWRAVVLKNQTIGGETRCLLLYLAERMNTRRMVSIPQTQVAEAFGVTPRAIRKRLADAHAAALLDTVTAAKPKVTAVYQGIFPTPPAAAVLDYDVRKMGAPGLPDPEDLMPAASLDESYLDDVLAPSDWAR